MQVVWKQCLGIGHVIGGRLGHKADKYEFLLFTLKRNKM